MAKRSVRDMLKARAWNRQVSLTDVDPGDHLGFKRRKIAAAREKYGPELLDLQERLFAEKKQAILIVLQGLDTSGKDGTVRHVMAAMNPQGVHVHPFITTCGIGSSGRDSSRRRMWTRSYAATRTWPSAGTFATA